MKLFSVIFLVISTAFYSPQKPVPDSRLIDYLGKEKVDFILKNNPQLIYYYNFYLENSWYLSPLPTAKSSSTNIEGEVVLPLSSTGETDKSRVNVLKLKVKRYYDRPSYYKIKNTKQLLVFLSERDFNEKYNTYRRKIGLLKD